MLTRLADVQLVAKRHGKAIAKTAKERLKAGKHALKLSFSAKRWPTGLSFKTKELTKPKPVPETGCENNPVSSGGGGGPGRTRSRRRAKPRSTAPALRAPVRTPSPRACADEKRACRSRRQRLWGRLEWSRFGVHLAGGHGARADTGAGQGATPQPVLGTADASTVLMGAATAGAPGEAWAYKVLPLDVPPPADSSGTRRVCPRIRIRLRLVAGPARVRARERRRLRLDDRRNAARRSGPAIPRDAAEPPSARITPHGGGLLVGEDSGAPERQAAGRAGARSGWALSGAARTARGHAAGRGRRRRPGRGGARRSRRQRGGGRRGG